MLKIENTKVFGWEAAIRGMRNPMNSWDKSDSGWVYECDEQRNCIDYDGESGMVKIIGDNDHDLMMRLAKAGSVHAKYRRMIVVTCDITAPLYWWKEFDTYKVGTVANSCSTMHKIHDKEFTLDDFSHEHLWGDKYERDVDAPIGILNIVIDTLNFYRESFLDCTVSKYGTKEECENVKKDIWWQMIQLLPTSYNQKRTVMMNYEVLVGMYRDRRNHKLDEWHTLCDWIKKLPCSEIITVAADELAETRAMLEATIAGQETLQKMLCDGGKHDNVTPM